MMQVAIYPETSGKLMQVLALGALADPPTGYTAKGAAITWSTAGQDESSPDSITINLKAERLVFRAPRLVRVDGRAIVLSALADHGASGTMRSISKVYILFLAP